MLLISSRGSSRGRAVDSSLFGVCPHDADRRRNSRRRQVPANIWRAPATASPAIPCPAARPLPAASKWARRSARSIRPTSRPIPRPASATTRSRISIARVRQGIAKDGHRLYPAMPYPSYAKLTDDDVQGALRFLHERRAAGAAGQQAERDSPGISASAGRWRSGTWSSRRAAAMSHKPEHDAAWNRGAYLVAGARPLRRLPHAARPGLPGKGARREQCRLISQGALLDAWSAPNLRGDLRTGLGRWSQADIVDIPEDRPQPQGHRFRLDDRCRQQQHALSDRRATSRAMAVYLKSLPASNEQSGLCLRRCDHGGAARRHASEPGAALYAGNCAVVPRARRQGLGALSAAARRQSGRARRAIRRR